jgi:hypothetical protein
MVDSFRSIIELWSSREAMAADLGAGADAGLMSKWWQRNKIPDKWWVRVASTEKAKNEGITLEVLARLAAGAGVSEEARA